MKVSRDQALRDPGAHVCVDRQFIRVGKPPLPRLPLGPASACEPVTWCADGTQHLLQSPHGGNPIQMTWSNTRKDWMPTGSSQGNRMSFTSEYLAAHGWKYVQLTMGVHS